ncbi:MazG family protein [Actinotalea sp. Marseille-Q4924]|uniref:MazG family protein n=1 Tax=Actinotalea sp. Marseille-Q4924 TaxID=2866571 RepID=UPI001CE49876|nr:MazG family protein [Actinotalea sp. Marseille-Q4924]
MRESVADAGPTADGPAVPPAEPSAGADPEAGGGIADLVAVMDRLRSPGGCPWDAEQTHESLVPYAVEEVAEVVEAVETGDRAGLREELGDLLLQVVFHARVAQDHPDDPFDIDDVARGIAAKLRRRHPHVFGDVTVAGAAEVHRNWDAIKQTEKSRASAVDGIPPALPALARAQKVLGRLRRAGLPVPDRTARDAPDTAPDDAAADLGARLLALVVEADAAGVDAEQVLRGTVRELEDRVRATGA